MPLQSFLHQAGCHSVRAVLLTAAVPWPAGGRVTGADSIAEMIRELHLSADAGKGFEGEMAALSGYSRCGAACKAAWEQLACSNLLPADSDVLLASFVEYEWLQS